MPNYKGNFNNAMTGHVDLGSDPDKQFQNRGGLDNAADIRDLLSGLVAAGKTGLQPSDRAAVYAHLSTLLGKEQSQKLINHVLVFNERPDVVGKNTDQLLTQFYDMGSRDDSVNKIIQSTKNLGQGVVSGSYQSSNIMDTKNSGMDVLAGIKEDKNNVAKVKSLSGGL